LRNGPGTMNLSEPQSGSDLGTIQQKQRHKKMELIKLQAQRFG